MFFLKNADKRIFQSFWPASDLNVVFQTPKSNLSSHRFMLLVHFSITVSIVNFPVQSWHISHKNLILASILSKSFENLCHSRRENYDSLILSVCLMRVRLANRANNMCRTARTRSGSSIRLFN